MGLRRSFKPTNFLQNGDFSKGTAGWSGSGATISVVNNSLSIVGSGTSKYPAVNQTTGTICASGKKIYCRAILKTTNTENIVIALQLAGTINISQINVGGQTNPVQNQSYLISGIKTLTDQVGNLIFTISNVYADLATANGKETIINKLLAIELNTCLPASILALSDADLKAWCDLNIPNWFDGTLGSGVINGTGGLK